MQWYIYLDLMVLMQMQYVTNIGFWKFSKIKIIHGSKLSTHTFVCICLHFVQQFHIISCKIKCYLATIISNSTGHDTQKFDASTHIHALTYLQASTYLHASTLQAQMYCLTECNSSPTLSLLSPPLHTAQGRMSDCRASPRNIHILDTTSFCANFVSTLMSSKINNVPYKTG